MPTKKKSKDLSPTPYGQIDSTLQQLLSGMPGKTEAQRLNYLQDLMKSSGVDLFNTNQPVQQYMPTVPDYVNKVEAVWGKDSTAGALFDAMDRGMSAKDAVDAARKQNLIPAYDPKNKGEVDYLKIATDWQTENLAKNEQANKLVLEKQKFDAEQAAKHKTNINDIFATPYEQMGQPSADRLLQDYAAVHNMGFDAGPANGVRGGNLPMNPTMQQQIDASKPKSQYQQQFNDLVKTNIDYRNQLNNRQKVPTAGGRQVLQNLAMMRLMGA